MIDLAPIRQELERRKGREQQLRQDLDRLEAKVTELVKEVACCEEAQVTIQIVAQKTQQELQYHIGELVTLAMASVFDDPYELMVEFVQRRGRTEADIWFVRDGRKLDPMSASGGGPIFVGAFALRVSLWSLAQPRTRPTLLLDEPFIRIKGDADNIKALQMTKEVANKIGLQIIMVSDERVPMHEIEAGADKVIRVQKVKKTIGGNVWPVSQIAFNQEAKS